MSNIGKEYLGRVNLVKEAQEVDNNPSTVLTCDEITGDVKLSPINNIAIKAFIKSNEDLSLAQRKDNTLYGILDRYTGEEVTLNKISSLPSGTTVDNVIFFQLGSEYFKRVYFDAVNIKWWGAVGDDSTDNHDAILDAVNYVVANKGGKILIPDDGIYITTPLVFPTVPIANSIIIPIELVGQTPPSQLFGTVGTLPPFPRSGSVLKCLSTTGGAIISTIPDAGDPLGFCAIKIIIKDLDIRTYQNPFITAIDGGNFVQMRIENVQVSTGVYSVDALEPTHNTAGIITPKRLNGALTQLRNVSISGYTVGLVVNEHTDGDGLNITCNKYGMTFNVADHASRFGRVCVQRNTFGAIWYGEHTVHISQFNLEHAGAGQTTPENVWQTTQYDIVDNNFFGRGEINWTSVGGGVGTDEVFTTSGGDLIKFKNSRFYQEEVQSGYRGGAYRIKSVVGVPEPSAVNSRPWELTNDKASFGTLSLRVGNTKDAKENADFTTVLNVTKEGGVLVGTNVDTGEKLQVTGTTRINVDALDLGLGVGNGTVPPFSVYGDGTVNAFNFNVTKGQVANVPTNPTDVVRLEDLGIKTTATTSSTVVVNPNTATSYRLNVGVTNVTLPPLANNEGKVLFLINNTGSNINVNSNAGGNDIWDGGSSESMVILSASVPMRLLHDGTQWIIL